MKPLQSQRLNKLKQSMIILFSIYPLTLVIPKFWHTTFAKFLPNMPYFMHQFFICVLIVFCMMYIISPLRMYFIKQ